MRDNIDGGYTLKFCIECEQKNGLKFNYPSFEVRQLAASKSTDEEFSKKIPSFASTLKDIKISNKDKNLKFNSP